MKAYILGCSHAAGSEIGQHPKLSFSWGFYADEYGYTHSYPVKIAQALGYQAVNHAIPGGSNDAMYRIFCSLKLKPSDIVIACWTCIDRTEILEEKSYKWIPITGGEALTVDRIATYFAPEGIPSFGTDARVPDAEHLSTFAKHWTAFGNSQWAAELNKAKNIEALNASAERQGIKVINIDSVQCVNHHGGGQWPLPGQEFFQWAVDRGEPKTQFGHFYESTHSKFADHCLKFIK